VHPRRADVARTVGQQAFEQGAFAWVEVALEIDEVDEAGADGADAGMDGFERGAQFGDAEIGNCEGAGKLDHGGGAFYRMRAMGTFLVSQQTGTRLLDGCG
jgi:hypothetical protein